MTLNPLSKAFVLLVTLLTVALSCFSVAVVGRQDEWKKKYESEHAIAASAVAQLATSKAQAAQLETEASAKLIDTERANQRLQSELTTASASASQAQASYNKAVADLESSNAALKIAIVNQDRTAQEREAYAKQYIDSLTAAHKLGEDNVAALARLAEVSDKLRRTQNDLDRFKEASIASAKQVEEASRKVSQLEAKVGEQKLPGSVSVAATQTISGAITAVGQASNGTTLVQVNVGEKDQVAQGMEFTISRGADYVGTMVVTSVNADVATGRLTNIRGAVTRGDAVYIRGYNR